VSSHETIPDDEAHRRLRSVREGRLLCGPETLQINLGNACNLNCSFCWNHSPLKEPPSPAWHRQRLSDEHLAKIIDALPRLRPTRVLLSGRGEPLLHPRVTELLETLRGLGLPVAIQTNGVGGLEPERLVELRVDRLLVNISAGSAAGYEVTHPGRGHLFECVVERLGRIASLRGDSSRPRVTLIAVIHRDNCAELLPLIELAAKLGAEGVQLKGMELSEGLESLMLDETARREVREQLRIAERRALELGVELRAQHLAQVARSSSPSGRFTESLADGPCYMGWYYLRVTCDGRVMFCCKDKLMGHLDQRSLYQLWRSPASHLQRLAGRDGDRSTGLFDHKCRACSNFARNREVGAMLAESSLDMVRQP
jgi:MoaA/NifB/PqqE/SkfB family radical SAM enzyme